MEKIRKLEEKKKRGSGRNNQGRITVRHRGGGKKRRYRIIDYKRSVEGVEGKVIRIEKDPNRTARIGLIAYRNGLLAYIIGYENMQVGDIIGSGDKADMVNGNVKEIGKLKVGMFVHNIEIKEGQGGRLVRSGSNMGKIVKKEEGQVYIKMRSGKIAKVGERCRATIGGVIEREIIKMKKAGENRDKGKRPQVRGCAMNPVDHPHGGRTRGGKIPVTPWGVVTKGKKTRRKKW